GGDQGIAALPSGARQTRLARPAWFPMIEACWNSESAWSIQNEESGCLLPHGKWYGEEAAYKRSGSGYYREYTRIGIPQSKAEIERFAAEHRYKIEWRGEIPEEAATGRVAVY